MEVSDKHRYLAEHIDLFKGLDPEDVAKIFARGMTMNVAKGDILFMKDTVGSQMFCVLGGLIAIYDGKKHLANLKAGDLFGEMAIICKEPRSATAVAAENSQLFVLNETTFNKLMTKRVAIRILLNIVGSLSTRLRDANTKLVRLTEKK